MKLSGKLTITAFAALLIIQGCAKQDIPSDGEVITDNVISLTISADRFAETNAEGATRIVTGNDGRLEWEGNESVGIIFSKRSSGEYKYVQKLNTLEGHPGVFSGTIDLGGFSVGDIVGMVCPYSDQSWGRYHSGTATRRIVMQIGTKDYTQEMSGKMNWNEAPFFAELSSADFKERDGGYVVNGKEMKCCPAIMEFIIYGKHQDGLDNEQLCSIILSASTSSNYPMGTFEWQVGNDKFVTNHKDENRPYLKTVLAEPHPINAESGNTAVVYTMTLPKKVQFTKVTVNTDFATYEKEITKSLTLGCGVMQPIKMDIASFTRKPLQSAADFSYAALTLERGGTDSNQKKFVYNYYEPLKDYPLDVYYYIPTEGDITKMPVLFAMHGNGRGASSLLKYWRSYAEARKFIVVVPHFSEEVYPDINYHLGGVSSSSTSYIERPYELRTYNIIEKLFDLVKDKTGNVSETYDMFGHSAGSQFTHRFLLCTPECRVGRAVSANAGYYTVPVPEGITDAKGNTYSFPYSIKGMNISDEQLAVFFARNLTIQLGTADNDPQAADLKHSAGAEAQGAYRLARGHYFFEKSKAQAEAMGVSFNWTLVEVPDVGHSTTNMIKTEGVGAAALLYGN